MATGSYFSEGRLGLNQIEQEFRSLRIRIDDLETKLELLLPGAARATVQGPCPICQQKWLVTQEELENGQKSAYLAKTQILHINSKISRGRKGPEYHRYPTKLKCSCSGICFSCMKTCPGCNEVVCLNHWITHPTMDALSHCDQCQLKKKKKAKTKKEF